jgi:hypothetical protein
MSTPATADTAQEPQRPYQDYSAEVLVEMLERQYDQDEPLNVEMVFELAVRALEAEATAQHV